MGVGREGLGSGGCEPRIEGIVQFIKEGEGVNQELMVMYNLKKRGGGVPGGDVNQQPSEIKRALKI